MANALTVDLLRAQYSGLDFDTEEDELRARMQVQFASSYNDFAVSSLGIMLLDIVSFGLDSLSFYLDRRVTDTFLSTARTRKSITRLSRQLGYKLRGAVASSADLDVLPDPAATYPLTIPKSFQFQGPNGLIFESAQAVTYTSSVTQVVPCSEGQTISETFFSDGTANQVFDLRRVPESQFIAAGSVRVTVAGSPWVEQDFLQFETTDQFETALTDDPPTVRFGDSVAGNIPTTGAQIIVTYFVTSGKSGQVAQGTINDVVNPLVIFFTNVDLTVNNPDGSKGGDDFESLDHAKVYAPKVYKTRLVAVTQGDYEGLSGAYADPLFGKVAVAQAVSARSAALDNELTALIADIKFILDPINGGIGTILTAMGATLTDLLAQATGTQTSLTDLAALATTADTDTSSAQDTARSAKNTVVEIGVDANDIATLVADGNAALDLIAPAATSQLNTADRASLKSYFDLIGAEAGNVGTAASAVGSALDSILATTGTVRDSLTAIGLTTSSGKTGDAYAAQTLILSDAADLQAGLAALAVQNALIGATGPIYADLAAIYNHVDRLLAADCKSNLVNVPILVRDAGGFLTSPAIGLVDSLQRYLDDRKEVTQNVIVVSGFAALVFADIQVRLGVQTNFAHSVVAAAVSTVIDGLLRERNFGESLYISEVYNAVLAQVSGIGFLNIVITGPSGSLDGSGNLVVPESQVISKGTVTITPETSTA